MTASGSAKRRADGVAGSSPEEGRASAEPPRASRRAARRGRATQNASCRRHRASGRDSAASPASRRRARPCRDPSRRGRRACRRRPRSGRSSRRAACSGSANGASPSSFQAPQPPTTTGLRGSLTSTIRKSGSPGVCAVRRAAQLGGDDRRVDVGPAAHRLEPELVGAARVGPEACELLGRRGPRDVVEREALERAGAQACTLVTASSPGTPALDVADDRLLRPGARDPAEGGELLRAAGVGEREDPDALSGTARCAPVAREIGVAAMEDDVAAVATGSACVREHLETGGLVAACRVRRPPRRAPRRRGLRREVGGSLSSRDGVAADKLGRWPTGCGG